MAHSKDIVFHPVNTWDELDCIETMEEEQPVERHYSSGRRMREAETVVLKQRNQRTPQRHPSWRESISKPLEIILAVGGLGYSDNSCSCQQIHRTRRRRNSSGESEKQRRRHASGESDYYHAPSPPSQSMHHHHHHHQSAISHSPPLRPSHPPSHTGSPYVSHHSSKRSLDDVDGRNFNSVSLNPSRKSSLSAPIVDAFIRLTFLKVLLVDIGISLGDFVMDFVQGINMILTPLSIDPVSMPFGIFLLATCWLPALVVPLHLGIKHYFKYLKERGIIESLILMFLFIGFFPLIPTLTYFCLLLTPRSSVEERRRYREVERRAHEIKSISSSLEAPIQLITLLYLMLRGVVALPWSEPISSSCVEDSLGRVACLPSIPMASVIFSILSIIKTMFDLNIYPFLTSQDCNVNSLMTSFKLFLRYMPFSISNAIFRITSFAFILVYLDYWAAIPGLLLLLINLVIFGFSFTRKHSNQVKHTLEEVTRKDDYQVQPSELTRFSTAQYSRPRQLPTNIDLETGKSKSPSSSQKSYKCEESNFNRNVVYLSEASPTMEDRLEPERLERQGSLRNTIYNRYVSIVSSIRSEDNGTPSIINEENTSIFYNSLSGMFFPSCHSHIRPFTSSIHTTLHTQQDEYDIEKLLAWQKGILQKQVYVFNTTLMLVVVLVWILVAFTSSFNYNSNILDPFWFSVAFSFLVISGIITLILASELNHPTEGVFASMFATVCKEDSETVPDSKELEEARTPPSPSASNHSNHQDGDSPLGGSYCGKVGICLLLSLLILIPTVAAVLIFKNVDTSNPHLFIVETQENSPTTNLGILSAFQVYPPRDRSLPVTGMIAGGCLLDETSFLTGMILVVNMTSSKCRILIQREDFFSLAKKSNVSAVVVLDNTPRQMWRVSSYYDLSQELSHPTISTVDNSSAAYKYLEKQGLFGEEVRVPTVMVREPDWSRYSQYLATPSNRLTLAWGQTSLDFTQFFICSSKPQIKLGVGSPSCTAGKHIYTNGTISENICVKGECWKYGQHCPNSQYSQFSEFTLNLHCGARDLDNLPLKFVSENDEVLHHDNLELSSPIGTREEYCCRDETRNHTLLAVEGEGCFNRWRDVEHYTRRCNWTSWIRGACLSGLVQVSRLCLVEGASCLLREYYTTACSSHQPLQLCKTNPRKC